MSYKFYTVDRIEEDIAVIFDEDDNKLDVPVTDFTVKLKEGDILRFDEETNAYTIDKEKTAQTKADIQERFSRLFKK